MAKWSIQGLPPIMISTSDILFRSRINVVIVREGVDEMLFEEYFQMIKRFTAVNLTDLPIPPTAPPGGFSYMAGRANRTVRLRYTQFTSKVLSKYSQFNDSLKAHIVSCSIHNQ